MSFCFYPTAYQRWERRDTAGPSLTLQTWWCRYSTDVCLPPETRPGQGEWQDVPTVQGPSTGTFVQQASADALEQTLADNEFISKTKAAQFPLM